MWRCSRGARAFHHRRAGVAEDDGGRAGFRHRLVPAIGLGEGTFLSLLKFIEQYAPDPVTAAVARRAGQDEARRMRLARLGFDEREAAEISALHTRNFM